MTFKTFIVKTKKNTDEPLLLPSFLFPTSHKTDGLTDSPAGKTVEPLTPKGESNCRDKTLKSPPCLYRNPEQSEPSFIKQPSSFKLLEDLATLERAEAANPKLDLGYADTSYKTPKRFRTIDSLETELNKIPVTECKPVRASAVAGLNINEGAVTLNGVNLTVDLKSPMKTSRKILSSEKGSEDWCSADALSKIAEASEADLPFGLDLDFLNF